MIGVWLFAYCIMALGRPLWFLDSSFTMRHLKNNEAYHPHYTPEIQQNFVYIYKKKQNLNLFIKKIRYINFFEPTGLKVQI